MERGALIGGVAVVGLLAVFAAVFVMVGMSSGTGGDVNSISRQSEAVEVKTPDGTVRKVDRNITAEDGPDGVRYFDADGVERAPNPPGRGAEEWAQIREQRNQEQVDRARTVMETFATGLDAPKATELRGIFDHLFDTSDAIRADRMDGQLTQREMSDQLKSLRTETKVELTTLLGGEEYARLQTELRRADAFWF